MALWAIRTYSATSYAVFHRRHTHCGRLPLLGGELLLEDLCEEFVIRRAYSREAEEIWSVTRLAYEPYRGKIRPMFQALKVSVATIRHEIRTRKCVYGVALCNGRVVATLRYRRRGRYLALARLAVHPEFQQRGLGKLMLAWAEDEARRCNVFEVRGEVRRALPHLLEFYRKLGFRSYARRSRRGYRGYLIAVKKRVARKMRDTPPPS